MIIDSHCHLNFLKLDEEITLDHVVNEAKQKGISKLISVATTLEDVASIKQTAHQFDNVYYSVGRSPK